MAEALKYAGIVGVSLLLGSSWTLAQRFIEIKSSGLMWTIAVGFLISGLTMAVLHLIFERCLPRINTRSFQAATSLAVVYFFIPTLITMYSLHGGISAVNVGLIIGLAPLLLWLFKLGRGTQRPIYLAAALAGAIFCFVGTDGYRNMTSAQAHLIALLLGATLLLGLGLSFSKKIFWIHSSLELNCWALLVAAGITFLLGSIIGDTWGAAGEKIPRSIQFWAFLIGYSVGIGVAQHLYRYSAFSLNKRQVTLFTFLYPLFVALIWAAVYWDDWKGKSLFNWFSVSGLPIYIISMVLASRSEGVAHWMSHCLTNTKRQGDRVICNIGAYMQKEKGTMATILVSDLSIGGLGFKTDTLFAVGDSVTVSFTLGESWTQVALECRVVHFTRINDPKFPYFGGVQFARLDDETMQLLVEFLAKLSHHLDHAA